MNHNIGTNVIYQFPNYSAKQCAEDYVKFITRINEEIQMHHHVDELCANGEHRQAFLDFNASGFNHIQPSRFARKTCKANETEVKETLLTIPKRIIEWEKKFKWLCDCLIRTSIQQDSQENYYSVINAGLLQYVVGKDYRRMLGMLEEKRLIYIREGKVSVKHGFGGDIFISESNQYMLLTSDYDKIEVTSNYYNIFQKKREQYFEKRTIKNKSLFLKNYRKNLSFLKIDKEPELQDWLNNLPNTGEHDKHNEYINMVITNLGVTSQKLRVSEDNNMRTYSILSNMPKELKSFVNRKFEVDISNCHPLLLNKVLNDFVYFAEYQHNTNELKQYKENKGRGCVQPHHSPSPILHPVEAFELVRKLQKDNRLQMELAKYKRLTESGCFWDYMLAKYPDANRRQVKTDLFASVFYKKSLLLKDYSKIIIPDNTPKQEYESDGQYAERMAIRQGLIEERNRCKYAADFRKEFPCIWRILTFIRKHDGIGLTMAESNKPRTWLANTLMALESRIIREVLQRLWDEGYKVLNIHDSIFVLDVLENQDLTAEHVKETLLNVLSRYCLKGNVKVEY